MRIRQHTHGTHKRRRRLYGRHHRPSHRPPHDVNRRRAQSSRPPLLIHGLRTPDDPRTRKQRTSRRLRDLYG